MSYCTLTLFAVNRRLQAKNLVHVVQPVTRHVDAAIDWLQHDRRAYCRQTIGGVAQVGDIGCFQFSFLMARRP
jgi:hypothetical protein